MEMQTMLNVSEDQDLRYVAFMLTEILSDVEVAATYGADFALGCIRRNAQDALERFQQPEGVIIFEQVR